MLGMKKRDIHLCKLVTNRLEKKNGISKIERKENK